MPAADDGIVVGMGKAALLGRSATYRDLCEVPDHLTAEILDGDLWVSPKPVPRHSHVIVTLGAELVPPFQHGRGGPGGWHFLTEVELHFHGDVLVPDLVGWRTERELKLMEHPYITQSPDWVCEILSKSTEKIDRGLKQRIYAREGVRHLWLVDPVKQTIEVLKLVSGTWAPILTLKGTVTAVAEPFDAVPFPLTRIWPVL